MLSRPRTPTSSINNKTHTILHPDKLQVFIKFKPPIEQQTPLTYINQNELQIQNALSNKIYQFNRIFHHTQKNIETFLHVGKNMIDQLMNNGGNGLIFVYGNTGTGKTYTMGLLDLLNKNSQGLIPQTIKYLFEKYCKILTIGFVEMYMDEIYDLFEYESEKKKIIRQDQFKQPYIENQIKINVNKIQQAYQLLNIGLEKRKVAEQNMNKRSSRGHGIITFQFNNHNNINSKLCFVDLAGSQRVKQSQSIGQTLNEAVKINSSLSALETLLMNISQESVRMYRANKLTRLLQPYIESGKIKLIVTSAYDSIQSIQFAKRCKGIQFKQKDLNFKKRQQKSLTPQKQKTKLNQQKQKNMFYCLSNLVGVLLKINQMIKQLIKSQIIHSNFTLEDIIDIKQIEEQINLKINNLEKSQQILLDQCINNKSEITKHLHGQIVNLIKQPNIFIEKIHQIGYQVCKSINNLSQLSHYKNIYKKQLFTSDVKNLLLSNKNKKFQENIYNLAQIILINNQNINSRNKLLKKFKFMGIDISNLEDKKKSIAKNINQDFKKQQKSKSSLKIFYDQGDQHESLTQTSRKSRQHSGIKNMRISQKIKNQRGQQNYPFNKIYNKSHIYIEEK